MNWGSTPTLSSFFPNSMTRLDAVIFDLDGPLVRYHGVEFESSWGALAVAAGTIDRSKELMNVYFPRKEAYAEWVEEEAKLMKGISVDHVMQQILPPPYAEGVRTAIEELRGSYRMGILSSGMDSVAEYVAQEFGFEFAWANGLEARDGTFTGRSTLRVDLWSKGEVLEQLAGAFDLDLDRVCFVGDNVNDLPAFERVGLAVAANPKDDRVAEAADRVIESFAELPPLLRAFDSDQLGSS